MKKLIKIFLVLLVLIFILILYMDYSDYRYINKLKKKIINNTDISDISYINYDGDYYIVLDDGNLYVYDNKFVELLKIDRILIHQNEKKYDIIYNNGKVMYINDYYKKKKLYYEYYDLYTYEKTNSVLVGGSNE